MGPPQLKDEGKDMQKSTLFGDPHVERDACFSPCERYRWSLSRNWDPTMLKPWVGWIMLNPSTADARVDDPTIRRCMAFSRAWGAGGCAIRNLFAWRSTDPAALLSVDDPVGTQNDAAITDLIGVCSIIVAAWGVHGVLHCRAEAVIRMFADREVRLHCLGTTKEGHPRHPLYVAGCTTPKEYTPCRQES